MIGLLGIGLGLYGVYTMKKDIKYTKQNLKVPKGVGTVLEQKINIDKNFLDILEYSGAKCKIVRDYSRKSLYKRGNIHYNITNTEPKQYGGMELYLMQKGYCKEAIEYAKNKYDNIAEQQLKHQDIKTQNFLQDFEYALKHKKTKELAVSFKINGYKNEHQIKKDNDKIIEYLHQHGNPTARVNVIIGGTTPAYDFDVTWVFFCPIGYDPHDYIESIQKKLKQR